MSTRRASRRRFLQSTAAATAATAILPSLSHRAKAEDAAPSDKPIIGSIGIGGRGSGIMRQATRYGVLAAVCDVDAKRLERTTGRFEGRVEGFEDYRKLLDRKDIDIVTIGTPDHWHTKIAIDAMRAGKDVYCEKPLTLTIDEGKLILKTLKETNRVFQVGTQQRSGKEFLTAIALVRAGRLGKLRKLTVGISQNPYSDAIAEAEVPEGLNWDMWLGQTPKVPYRWEPGVKHMPKNRGGGDGGSVASNCHYEFRWWYAYSGGKMTDWGAHHVDIAQWIIGQTGPDQGLLTVEPVNVEHAVDFDKNGDPVQKDRYNVPKTFEVSAKFPGDVEMVITSEGRNGILVEGTKGRIFVNRGGLNGAPAEALAQSPLPEGAIEAVYGGPLMQHMQNFMECVKSRRKPVSDVSSHHRAVTTCHLSNIALRLGRKISWDAKTEEIVGDDVAKAMQSREQRKGYEIS